LRVGWALLIHHQLSTKWASQWHINDDTERKRNWSLILGH
jgi:hypothetical protein